MGGVTSGVSFSTPAQLAQFQQQQYGSYAGDSGPGTISNGPALQYGQTIMNTALDPQNALYNQLFQQNTDQTRAGLAARGLDTSATGQGIENQSNQNFNLGWQNAQLGRQVEGAGAYQGLAGLAQNIANTGFQNSNLLGLQQYRAPAAQPSMPGGTSMPGFLNPWANNSSTADPTAWSATGGDYWGANTPNYNSSFNWGNAGGGGTAGYAATPNYGGSVANTGSIMPYTSNNYLQPTGYTTPDYSGIVGGY